MILNILGTNYTLETKTEEEMPILSECDGYCDTSTKRIYIKDFNKNKEDNNSLQDLNYYANKVARHEIIHAFLFESGLSVNSENGWAVNEEMIDWIAIQLPKMFEVIANLKDENLLKWVELKFKEYLDNSYSTHFKTDGLTIDEFIVEH